MRSSSPSGQSPPIRRWRRACWPTRGSPEARARPTASCWPPSVLPRGWSGPADEQLLRRLRFAGGDVDVAETIRAAAYGARSLDEVTLRSALTPAVLDR